jgi:nitrile hydratase subunit alpha
MASHHTSHGYSHDPAQKHTPRPGMEGDAELSYYARRARAMEALLLEKGVCKPGEVQGAVDTIDARSPADVARVVARAWVDPEFKARLLANPKAALAELGYTMAGDLPQLVVVENTEEVHHLVVCTLCSCYPRALLGRPPDWYKSLAYRSRAVVDPRGVMQEFGLELDKRVTVRVLDSTADMRYLVLPQRPPGTENLSEAELAKLVTRDSMIGVTQARSPELAQAR